MEALVNWHKNYRSRLVVNARLWRFYIYFRVRDRHVSGDKILIRMGMEWNGSPFFFTRSFLYEFDYDALNINGKRISFSLLEDLVENDAFKKKDCA